MGIIITIVIALTALAPAVLLIRRELRTRSLPIRSLPALVRKRR